MFLRLSVGSLVAALCVCSGGCGADFGAASLDDAGGAGVYAPEDSVPAGSRELILISDPQLALMYGETSNIEVALRASADGTPVAGAHVSFSLQGPQDSTLAALAVATDGDGIAENELMAGELTGAFTLEVSAPGANPLTVQVAVSNAGFGMLVVEAPYDGDRLVARRRIAVVQEVECDAVAPGPGDHMVLLSDPMVAGGTFQLPAGLRYTVAAMADSADGTLLARGCAPSVPIVAAEMSLAVVTFEDLPLTPEGSYALQATLHAAAPAATLADAFTEGATEALETDDEGVREADGAEARLILDALEQTLRADPYATERIALADALAAERAMPAGMETLGAQLGAALDGSPEGHGPRAAIDSLAGALEAAVALTELTVDVEIGETLRWQPLGISSAPLDDEDRRASLDLSKQPAATVDLSPLAAQDGIAVSQVHFEMPWGALSARSVRQLASNGLGGHDDALRERFGCGELETFVSDLPLLQGMCDADCAATACDAAIGRVLDGGADALSALGEARPTVTLDLQLLLYDDTGDLGVDRMATSQLLGLWDPADGQDDVEAFNGGAMGELVLAELLAQ